MDLIVNNKKTSVMKGRKKALTERQKDISL